MEMTFLLPINRCAQSTDDTSDVYPEYLLPSAATEITDWKCLSRYTSCPSKTTCLMPVEDISENLGHISRRRCCEYGSVLVLGPKDGMFKIHLLEFPIIDVASAATRTHKKKIPVFLDTEVQIDPLILVALELDGELRL